MMLQFYLRTEHYSFTVNVFNAQILLNLGYFKFFFILPFSCIHGVITCGKREVGPLDELPVFQYSTDLKSLSRCMKTMIFRWPRYIFAFYHYKQILCLTIALQFLLLHEQGCSGMKYSVGVADSHL